MKNTESIKNTEKKKIILSAGGTGGHIFPAYALAEQLHTDYDIIWLADEKTSHFLDAAKCDTSIFSLKSLKIAKNGDSLSKKILFILSILYNTIISILFFLKHRPTIVIGFGGWPTIPAMLAGIVLRKHIVIHEQNAVFGRVNRLLAPFASLIALSYEKTKFLRKKDLGKAITSGNIIRNKVVREIEEQVANDTQELVEKNIGDEGNKNSSSSNGENGGMANSINRENGGIANSINQENGGITNAINRENGVIVNSINRKNERITIFITGGSQGSKKLNLLIPKAISLLPKDLKKRMLIYHQTGQDSEYNKTNKGFKLHEIGGVITKSFFDEITQILLKSDIIISRAGGSILAEISLLDKKSILIPLKISTDNHQFYNAIRMKNVDIIEEDDLIPHKVADLLNKSISELKSDKNASISKIKTNLREYRDRMELLKKRISTLVGDVS